MTSNDRATPNLPSRDLIATAELYARLGFVETFRDDDWLILNRDGIQIEFFPWPDLNPYDNIASCCLRVSDAAALREVFSKARLPRDANSIPRLTELREQPWGMFEFALVDLDGNLLRCLSPSGDNSASTREDASHEAGGEASAD